jgi:DNA-binding NarL/FixJ family response regulator
MTAIVADDELSFCALVRSFARLPGLTFLPDASDGEEALVAIIRHEPDIAVLDIQMPGKSGVHIAQEIVRRKLKTRVLLIETTTSIRLFGVRLWASFISPISPIAGDSPTRCIRHSRP